MESHAATPTGHDKLSMLTCITMRQTRYHAHRARQTDNAYMHYYETEKLSILTCTIMRQTHCHTKSAGLCQCLHALIQDSRDAMPTGHKNCQCCYATMLNRHNMMSMVACISSKHSRCHIYKKQHSVNAYMHFY